MPQPDPRQPGANGSTPQSPRYSNLPYSCWPADRRPRIRCGGCNEQMEPTGNPAYPHEWKCPGECDGYVDLFPPVTVPATTSRPRYGPSSRECGAVVAGVRCGQPLDRGELCCETCERRIVDAMWSDDGNPRTGRRGRRQHILDLVGNLAFQRERAKRLTKEKNEKAAKAEAARVARQDTSHHVVYYVRLGRNHIKIGTTGDLPRRMAELRCVNADNLLAAEPGGPDVEKQRHQQFKKWRYHVRKEDFGESRDLLRHIAEVRAEHGDPYALAAELVKRSPAA